MTRPKLISLIAATVLADQLTKAAALSLLSKGLSTEALLRLLKTDLCGFAPEEIAVLENYAYTWQL